MPPRFYTSKEIQRGISKWKKTSSEPPNKFITPTVINGKVYVSLVTGIGVFGLNQ